MATRPISVTIKGEYSDKDVKRAIRDLQSLQKEGPKTAKATAGLTGSLKGLAVGAAAAFSVGAITDQLQQMAMAAAQDQKTVVALGRAMSNVGLGAQTAEMEDYVKATMLATGTSDELIRQGLTRLTVATKDTAQAQRLLNLALDLSAAGYGDVVTMSSALSKAATGNVTALKRLGVPLDANAVKAKDFESIITGLSTTFRGQAAAAANTYAGQIQRVNNAVGEAQETVGYALLNALNDVSQAFGGTNGFISTIDEAGQTAADFTAGVGGAVTVLAEFGATLDDLKASESALSVFDMLKLVGTSFPGITAVNDAYARLVEHGEELNAQKEREDRILSAVTGRYMGFAAAAGKVPGTMADIQGETDGATDALTKQISAVDKLKAALDKLAGKTSVKRQRLDLQDLLARGPAKSGERTVIRDGKEVTERFSTGRDKKRFALDVADARRGLAETILEQGNQSKEAKAAARRQFALGRENLAGLNLGNYTAGLLTTPAEFRPQNASGLDAVDARRMQGITNIYQFGDIRVDNLEQAIEQARRAERLKALGGRGAAASAARYTAMAAAS